MSQSSAVIYAATFCSGDAGGADPIERVEHFTAECCQGVEPEDYATSMLMKEGEWLDDLAEEPADTAVAPAVIGRSMNYIEDMAKHGMSDLEIDLHNDLSRLRAAFKAVGAARGGVEETSAVPGDAPCLVALLEESRTALSDLMSGYPERELHRPLGDLIADIDRALGAMPAACTTPAAVAPISAPALG